MDLAALVRSQKVAGSADFQVAHGDAETGAQLVGLEDGVDALAGRVGDFLVVGQQQVGIGAVIASADASAQLIELGEAEPVGAVYDDGVDVGHVEAGLYDGGAHQHVGLPVGELHHHVLELGLGHLAVADDEAGFGHQFLQFFRGLLDGADAVVQEENLAVAFHLAQDGLAHEVAAVLGHERLDGQAGLRRCVDHAHVAYAGEGHVQGARDRSGREGEDVHLGAHLLKTFLVGDAEAVFLIDDDQPEVVEPHVLLQDPVGSDDDIDRAGFGRIDDIRLLLVGAEAAQHLDLDGIGREPFGKGGVVLLR